MALMRFQALIHALEGICTVLEERRCVLLWRGGESSDGGFPRYVPMFYGRQFTATVNKLIDKEIVGFAEIAESLHRSSKEGSRGRASALKARENKTGGRRGSS
jgi:hypothetical protein